MAISIKRTKPLPAGCAIIFGLIFLCGGLALAWFLGVKVMSRAGEIESWDKVPCVVKKLELTVNTGGAEPSFGTDALYEYQHGGQPFTGTNVFDGSVPGKVNEIEEILHGFRSRPQTACLVNPAAPAEAVLVPPSRGTAYLLLGLGAVLALVGLLVMLSPLFRRNGGGGRSGPLAGFIVTLVFAIAGGTCLWFAMRDDWEAVAGRMVEAPCSIVSSRVKVSTSTSKGRTTTNYRPHILYRYQWQGRDWHSEWTDFSKNSYSTGTRSSSEEIVRRHPIGAAQKCWVDPQQPWMAVLEKNTRGAWVLLMFGGIFAGLGVLGLLYFAGKILFLRVLLRSEKQSGPPPLP